jgi:hypothetical protein
VGAWQREWFEDGPTEVLVDDGGAHVGDLGTFGEPVDDEGVQGVGVGDGHVDEEVLPAGDDEDADRLGKSRGEVAERLDPLARGWPDPDGDEGLHGATESRQVDIGVVAPDHTAGAQRPDPFQGGGRGDTDTLGELAVGQPSICLQVGRQRRI